MSDQYSLILHCHCTACQQDPALAEREGQQTIADQHWHGAAVKARSLGWFISLDTSIMLAPGHHQDKSDAEPA